MSYPAGSCGSQYGYRNCQTTGHCCSQYGWCGNTTGSSGHCNSLSQIAYKGPTATPVAASYPAGSCGSQYGNRTCQGTGDCCSQYGWCGTTTGSSGHCNSLSQTAYKGPTAIPVAASYPAGSCGSQYGNRTCQNGLCCSQYGWCGTTTGSSGHCNSLSQTAYNGSNAPIPIDCVLNDWTFCSNGIRTKSIKTHMSNNGTPCPSETDDLRRQTCGTDCVLNDWTPCSNGIRTRSIKTNLAGGGKDCLPETDLTRTQTCGTDCVLNDWTPCSNGIRTRSIKTNLSGGGKDCLPETDPSRTQTCGTDCVLNDWTPCSNGIRTKSIKTNMSGGGKDCLPETDPSRRQNCNDCSGNWIMTECEATCDGIQTSKIGSRISTYKIITPASNGGVSCNIPDGKIEIDNNCKKTCSIDCIFSDWSELSECDCNTKIITRKKKVINNNSNCNDIIENQNCSNNDKCLKLDCNLQYKFYNLETKQCQSIFDYILINLTNLFK